MRRVERMQRLRQVEASSDHSEHPKVYRYRRTLDPGRAAVWSTPGAWWGEYAVMGSRLNRCAQQRAQRWAWTPDGKFVPRKSKLVPVSGLRAHQFIGSRATFSCRLSWTEVLARPFTMDEPRCWDHRASNIHTSADWSARGQKLLRKGERSYWRPEFGCTR